MSFKNRPDFRRIQDSEGDFMRISSVGAIFADPGSHARTGFDKRFFYGHEFSAVGSGSTVSITIYTSNKFPHGQFFVTSNDDFSYNFELSTASKGDINGTIDYQYNVNRGRNHDRSVASFFYGDTVASHASNQWKVLEEGRSTAGKFSTPDSLSTIDWLLDDERVYNLLITNEGDGESWITIHYLYHEHNPLTMENQTGSGESETEYGGEQA